MATVEIQAATAAFQEKSPMEQEKESQVQLEKAVEALAVSKGADAEEPSKEAVVHNEQVAEAAEEEKDDQPKGAVEATEEVAAEPEMAAVVNYEAAALAEEPEELATVSDEAPPPAVEEEAKEEVEDEPAVKEAPCEKTDQ